MSDSQAPGPDAAPSSMNSTFDRIEALLTFPCDFPIKVIGHPLPGFEADIADIVARHVPGFDASDMGSKPSRRGRFLSLTVEVRVQDRTQLQTLYQALADHPQVRIVI